MKILIILTILLPFIGSTLFIFSSIESNNLWIYGCAIVSLSILLFVAHYFYAIYSLKILIDAAKGIKTKNDKEFIYMNIHFKREIFTRKNFLEYKEHYTGFYLGVNNKIKHPFI